MKQMFLHVDELLDAQDYDAIDKFIEEFCNAEPTICLQYYYCLLTSVFRFEYVLMHVDALREKAIEVGTKEIGEEDALRTLYGLL